MMIAHWVLFFLFGSFAFAKTGLLLDPVNDTINNKNQHIIFITTETYSGNLGGIRGATDICQREAYQKGSIIPPGLTFKPLLVTGAYYPCDAKQLCGGEHASKDWPLTPSTPYQTPDLRTFNQVNVNSVFDGKKTALQLADGKKVEQTKKLWIGTQSVLSDAKGKDIVGWASADENPDKDAKTYTVYSPSDCAGFTSSSILKKGTVGEIGVVSGSGYGNIPASTWGNYFVFSDKKSPFIYNMWITSEVLICNAKAAIVCVS